MVALRLQVKFFVENPAAVDLPAVVPVFHRWIQQKSVAGLLIDVADYKHVPQGPGIMLIGHEGDYSLDMGAGRPGLLYTRKRRVDNSLQEQLHQSIKLALTASRLLEGERSFSTPLRFRKDEIEVRLADRLAFPNRPETLYKVRSDLEVVLAEVYQGASFELALTSSDQREVFAVTARTV